MKSRHNFRGPSSIDGAAFDSQQFDSVKAAAYQSSAGGNVFTGTKSPVLQRKLSEPDKDDLLMRKELVSTKPNVNTNFEASIEATKSGGVAIDAATQNELSPKFGRDFSGVKIHNNSRAHHLANEINARAFTLGQNIYFNQGEYQPNSREGKKLLAHELTHTVQQGASQTTINRKKSKKYTFKNCTKQQFNIIDRNIIQAYAMVNYGIKRLTSVVGLMGTAKNSSAFSEDTKGIIDAARIEFGAGNLAEVGQALTNFLYLKARLMGGLDVSCHNDPKKNQIAEAAISGKQMEFGPDFFNKMTDSLLERPRVVIHELGHNIGMQHTLPAMNFVVKPGKSTVTNGGQAHGADSTAVFAYRIFTKRYRGSIDKKTKI